MWLTLPWDGPLPGDWLLLVTLLFKTHLFKHAGAGGVPQCPSPLRGLCHGAHESPSHAGVLKCGQARDGGTGRRRHLVLDVRG